MDGQFRYARRVQFGETDMAGIVHFSWMFRYMEEAEHAAWRAAALSIAEKKGELGWPRVAASFEFRSPLRFEDEFEVAVRLVGDGTVLGPYSRFVFNHPGPLYFYLLALPYRLFGGTSTLLFWGALVINAAAAVAMSRAAHHSTTP